MEEPEKREALTELLADVTEEPTETVIDSVFEFWNKLKQDEEKKAREEKEKALEVAKGKAEHKMSFLQDSSSCPRLTDLCSFFFFLSLCLSCLAEKERASLSSNLNNSQNREGALSMSSRHVVKNMTKEERKKRDALLAQYGYDLDEMVEGADGELEIVYKDRSAKASAAGNVSSADPLMMANNNSEIQKQKDAVRRAEMKKASETEKERNKLALEKQRLAQEKEKKRTQKGEKRRM